MTDMEETQLEEAAVSDHAEQKDIWIVLGNYEGLLPCDDCEGVATYIQLDEEMNFHLSQKYVGTDRRSEPRSGKYSFADNVVTLLGVADEPNKYLLETKTCCSWIGTATEEQVPMPGATCSKGTDSLLQLCY